MKNTYSEKRLSSQPNPITKKAQKKETRNDPTELSSCDFVPAILHEIRSPLNAIIGFSQILLNEDYYNITPHERADYIKDINESANDLNELISDLLDISTPTSSSPKTFIANLSQKVDVKDLIKRSIKVNRDYAMGRNIKITAEIDEDLEPLHLDAKRMKQILTNLISNAIKYSPKQTEVKIIAKKIIDNEASCGNQTSFLEISVIDNGFGMSDEQVKTAFEKYQTINNPNSGEVKSFGLGLPIVKQLTELQKGTIAVKSEIGKGSEFILRFLYQTTLNHKQPPIASARLSNICE